MRQRLFYFLQRVLPASWITVEHCDHVDHRALGILIWREDVQSSPRSDESIVDQYCDMMGWQLYPYQKAIMLETLKSLTLSLDTVANIARQYGEEIPDEEICFGDALEELL